MAQGKKSARLVYEDDHIMAILAEKQSALGHIKVFPKKHIESMEKLDENEKRRLFLCASLSASAVFEGLGAHGTNLIGTDDGHVVMDILPRKAEDGINLQWKPKKMEESKLKQIKDRISEETFMIGKAKKKEEKPKAATQSAKQDTDQKYIIDQIRRIP